LPIAYIHDDSIWAYIAGRRFSDYLQKILLVCKFSIDFKSTKLKYLFISDTILSHSKEVNTNVTRM